MKKAETGRSGLTTQQVLRSLILMRIKDERDQANLIVADRADRGCEVANRAIVIIKGHTNVFRDSYR